MILEHKFSVGFRNIEGMHDGTGYKISEIKSGLSCDIEILVETWGCDCEGLYDDYIPYYVSPQKHQGVKKGRRSGGIYFTCEKLSIKKFQNCQVI